jgi:integrase
LISSDRASVKRYRHGILLMIFSGVRPGEICGSEWSNIDFKECTYKVRKTWRRSGSKCEEKSTTKTGTIGERTVPFHPLCLSYLKSAKERSNSKWILENHKTKQPIRTENLRKVVRQIAKDAGLLTNRNIYPYLFRHTFITDAARSGILPIDLRFLVGHVDDKMINKVYAFHYDENAINKYRNIFNSMFETGINHENS